MSLKSIAHGSSESSDDQEKLEHKTSKKKPFTKSKPMSADQINCWSNNEFDAGMYFPDQNNIIKIALEGKLKGRINNPVTSLGVKDLMKRGN